MANEQLIDEIVSPVTGKQLADLGAQLDIADAKLTKAAVSANTFVDSLQGAKSFADYATKAKAATDAVEGLTAAQKRSADVQLKQQAQADAIALKKQAQAAKELDAANKQAQKDKEYSDKKAAIQAKADAANQKYTQKELDSLAKKAKAIKEAAQNEADLSAKQQAAADRRNNRDAKLSEPYIKLTAALKEAERTYQNLAVELGTENRVTKAAADDVLKLRKAVDSVDQPIGKFQRNVGNYASGAFEFIRKAAYILPGIGIAGIFNLLGDGLAKLTESLQTGQAVFNTTLELTKKTNDAFADEYQKVRLLTTELHANGTAGERQTQIIEDLNRISPTYFGNLKSTDDITTKLTEDTKKYNEALLITSRITAAQSLIGEKYKAQLEAQSDLINNNLLKQINLPGSGSNLAKSIFTSFVGKSDEATIKNATQSIAFLTKQILSDQKKLQANGGDIAGEQIKIQERIIASDAEVTKIKLKTLADANQKIADDEKKSYSFRQNALKQAEAANLQIADISNKVELNDITLTNDKKAVIVAQGEAEQLKITQDYDKASKKLREDQSKDILEGKKQDIENEKDKQKLIFDNESNSFERRLKAVEVYQKKSKELIDLEANAAIKDAGDVEEKKTNIRKKATDDRRKIDIDANNEFERIRKEQAERLAKDLADVFTQNKVEADSSIQDIQRAVEAANQIQEEAQNKESAEIDRQYRDREISKKEHDKRLLLLDDQYNVTRLARLLVAEQAIQDVLQKKEDNDVATATGFGASPSEIQGVKNNSGVGAQKSKVSGVVKQLRAAQAKLTTDDSGSGLEDFKKNSAIALQATSKIAEDASRLIQAEYQNEIDLLEQKKQLIQDNANLEIQAVNNSISSERTKQNQINIINAKAAQQQKVIDEQVRQEKHRAAVAQKDATLAQILIQGALAVVSALPNYILAAIVGAGVAAEFAFAASTPIPSFAKGVTNFEGGVARYGEAGTEFVKEPGKSGYFTKGETIGYLPRGTDIISNMELLQMAKPAGVAYRDREQVGWKEVVDAIKGQKQTKQPRPVVNVHVGGGYGLRR